MALHVTRLAEMESKLEAALCNIRIVGLPKGSEATNLVAFFSSGLPELLKVSFKGGSVKLDCCHRTLGCRPPLGQRPRAVIAKLHTFQDKAQIIHAARKAQIMTFEDFSIAVVQKQWEFYPVKQQLKEKGIGFAMLYPAMLRINHGRQEKFFKHPKDVAAFLEKMPQCEGSPSVSPAD